MTDYIEREEALAAFTLAILGEGIFTENLANIPAADVRPAAEVRELKYALLLMIEQYCPDVDRTVSHRWMTAGEAAFRALGIENYTSASEVERQIEILEESMMND